MIQANELRIGNLILLDGTHYGTVVAVDARNGIVVTENPFNKTIEGLTGDEWLLTSDYIRPIPLTPDILQACGFEKDRNGWHIPGTQFSLTDQFYPCWLDKMLWPQDIPDFKHLSLKYVHQLQNLFYFLSGGIELTINSEQVKV